MRDRSSYNAYHRDYKRRRHAEMMEEFRQLLGGRCARCGSADGLEFDHIDRRTKLFDIASFTTRKRATLLAELSKCQLLCSACHLQKTRAARDNGQVDHGGGVSGKKNCPCDLCRARKREYMREYQQRRRARAGAA